MFRSQTPDAGRPARYMRTDYCLWESFDEEIDLNLPDTHGQGLLRCTYALAAAVCLTGRQLLAPKSILYIYLSGHANGQGVCCMGQARD